LPARKPIASKMKYNATSMNENMISMGVDENEIKEMLVQIN
jgi:hypothetical protein